VKTLNIFLLVVFLGLLAWVGWRVIHPAPQKQMARARDLPIAADLKTNAATRPPSSTPAPTNVVASPMRTNSAAASPVRSAKAKAKTESPASPEENEFDKAYKALEQSQPKVAIGMFRKALQKEPANRRGRFGLSTALIQVDQYKEALEILEIMLKETPKDYVLKNNTAWIYATARDTKMRNGTRAIQLAQEALLLNPLDYHVWSTLAEAYFISGRYDKALRNAQEALRVGRDTGADAKSLVQYELQIERCRRAVESSSLLE
jgi:tetratricopeptide (TPR) repeat protein